MSQIQASVKVVPVLHHSLESETKGSMLEEKASKLELIPSSAITPDNPEMHIMKIKMRCIQNLANLTY